MTRRSSPAEDYIWTLNGVSSLIDQQQQLLGLFGYNKEEKNEDKMCNKQDDSDHTVNEDSTNNALNKTAEFKASSSVEIRENVTRSSSSSIQTLRRILEIEELKKFSDNINNKIEAKYPEWIEILCAILVSLYLAGPLLLSVKWEQNISIPDLAHNTSQNY